MRVLTASTGANLIKKLNICSLPNFQDLMPELLIGLVNVALGFNRERRSDKRKERCIEIN